MGGRPAARIAVLWISRRLCGFSFLLACPAFTGLQPGARAALLQATAAPAKTAREATSAGFNALLKEATMAREADHTDEAIRLYQRVVKAKPDFTEGWWYLGTLYYESDQYPDGRAAFRHVTGLKPQR